MLYLHGKKKINKKKDEVVAEYGNLFGTVVNVNETK